jgi:hypothetical protein
MTPSGGLFVWASVIVKMNRQPSKRASQRMAVLPAMTVMNVPKRPIIGSELSSDGRLLITKTMI